MTESEFLSLSPPRRLAALMRSIESGFAQNQEYKIYGAGTVYSLTGTQALIDLGTTDPTIVLGVAGTYLIMANLVLAAAGATVTTQTATAKLRRTNNTAADLTNGSLTIDLPVMTTLTHTVGSYVIGPVIYTTTNTDDVISMYAAASAVMGAGTMDVANANIVAVKLY